MSIITRYRHVTAVGIRAVRRIVFARFEGGKRVFKNNHLKINHYDLQGIFRRFGAYR